jgi:hypothetical protein
MVRASAQGGCAGLYRTSTPGSDWARFDFLPSNYLVSDWILHFHTSAGEPPELAHWPDQARDGALPLL